MTRFYNILAALAVILTPVAMMTAFGWSAYSAVLAETGAPILAAVSGIATAAAIEVIGIVAGETALWFHGRHDARWKTAALILTLYVLFGLYILAGTRLAPLPVMAGAVYVLVGLRAQAARETAAENGHAAEAAAWEQEKWRIVQADKTRVKVARASTQWHYASGVPARASTVPASSQHDASTQPHVCERCERQFASVQALNAHKRFCARESEQ